ncbi:hypothetical protein [Aquibacillus sediminis]|uniref:hypothetical protein n=1 Tax=Aquibacillus sediminis TaxID=2574734 RepID=UPI001108CC87|nr:hypothetical protein [Aquibacillus sediminis]
MRWIIFLILPLTLIACSNDEQAPTIEKDDVQTEESDPKPSIVEKPKQNETDKPVKTVLEFKLPNEVVSIHLDGVPILQQYLSSVENRQQAADKMTLTPLNVPEKDDLYLLEFSCIENKCSYLLLDREQDGRSFLIADLAKFANMHVSPNQEKLLFIFNRNPFQKDNNDIVTSKIAVMDLKKWESTPVATTNHLVIRDYMWPIQNSKWLDNQTISIDIPALEGPTNETLEQWFKSNKETKTIKLNIHNQ